MKIIITGDFVVDCAYSTHNVENSIIHRFQEADYNIVNLECPITSANHSHKILKTGPHLKGEKDATQGLLKQLNIKLLTLANNHIMDYGRKGLEDTLLFSQENEIETIGVGRNRNMANKAKRLNIEGIKVSIINFAENEWSNSTNTLPGANPMDLIDNVKLIQLEKENSDFVFVIVHGGHEYYNLPSPRMLKQYRFYVDNGADLVVGHHTHCISGYEKYKGSQIFYSLGNFLFTKPSTYEDWYNGMALEISINQKKEISVEPFYVQQSRKDFSLKLLTGEDFNKINSRFEEYSLIISNDEELKKEWENFLNEKKPEYLNYLSPKAFISNRYFLGILKKLGIKLYNKRGQSILLNFMRCEAHRDLSIQALEQNLK